MKRKAIGITIMLCLAWLLSASVGAQADSYANQINNYDWYYVWDTLHMVRAPDGTDPAITNYCVTGTPATGGVSVHGNLVADDAPVSLNAPYTGSVGLYGGQFSALSSGYFINNPTNGIYGWGQINAPLVNNYAILGGVPPDPISGNIHWGFLLEINAPITQSANGILKTHTGGILTVNSSVTGGQVFAMGYGTVNLNSDVTNTIIGGGDGTGMVNLRGTFRGTTLTGSSNNLNFQDALFKQTNTIGLSTLASGQAITLAQDGGTNPALVISGLTLSNNNASLIAKDGQAILSWGGPYSALILDGATNPLQAQNGGSFINDTTIMVGGALSSSASALLLNRGTITAHNGNFTVPGTITNDTSGWINSSSGWDRFTLTLSPEGVIRGGGIVAALIDNYGVIRAGNNQTMEMRGNVTIYDNGYLTTEGSGNTLSITGTVKYGSIRPAGGTITVSGGWGSTPNLDGVTLGDGTGNVTFQHGVVKNSTLQGPVTVSNQANFKGTNTNLGMVNIGDGCSLILEQDNSSASPILTNNGTIRLNYANNPFGTYLSTSAPANLPAILTGTGRVVLGGESRNTLGSPWPGEQYFINDTNHTIEGGGTINAAVTNRGQITANNGTMTISGAITGSGNVSVANGGALQVNTNLQTGNFSMSQQATLNVASDKYLELTKNFTFYQTDAASWNSGAGAGLNVKMRGAGAALQSLEIGGKDYGETEQGFTGNFHLANLRLDGNNTYVYLTDDIDNGQRGPSDAHEALYVESLYVPSGTTLNLHFLNLYVDIPGHSPHLLNTWTGDMSWLGGGTIVNAEIPAPSTMLLLGSGLAALGAWRRRQKA